MRLLRGGRPGTAHENRIRVWNLLNPDKGSPLHRVLVAFRASITIAPQKPIRLSGGYFSLLFRKSGISRCPSGSSSFPLFQKPTITLGIINISDAASVLAFFLTGRDDFGNLTKCFGKTKRTKRRKFRASLFADLPDKILAKREAGKP
jgi:hypothetical protein